MSGQIAMSQEAVLRMIGEREVKIAFLMEQLGMMGQEVAKLKARLAECKCAAEPLGTRTGPPSDEGGVCLGQ